MAGASGGRDVSKADGEPEADDAPKGLWSDRPPAMPPPRASKAKGTLIGHAAPPPPPGKLPIPKVPKGGLPPAPARPKVQLVMPRPKAEEPLEPIEGPPTIVTTRAALEKPEIQDIERLSSSEFEIVSAPEIEVPPTPAKAVFPRPDEVDPAVAFKVDPVEPRVERVLERVVAPPPMPRPPAIPSEAKRPPVPLESEEAAGPVREDREPRLLSSMPPPPPDLGNPFEPGAEAPVAAQSRGFEPMSAGIGFVVGAAIAALVAFLLWPSAPPAPLAAAPPTPGLDEPAPIPVDEPVADVTDEPVADEQGADEQGADEPVADEQGGDEPVAEVVDEPEEEPAEPVAVAPRPRPEPVAVAPRPRPRPEPVATPRPRPEPVAVAPRPTPRPVDDGPAIAAETPTRAPRPTGDRPATPTRQDVAAAIEAIRPQLRQCAPELTGHVANVRFTFVSSGRATSAMVPNDFGSPPQRSCVARVARQASVPAFSDPQLVVTYPVQF